jgi:hypothetical protein
VSIFTAWLARIVEWRIPSDIWGCDLVIPS